MVASRLLGAVAARVILLSFAAGSAVPETPRLLQENLARDPTYHWRRNHERVRCSLPSLAVAQAVDNHRCIACGHDRPVLEPLAIASSLSICPSCDEALHQELRNAYLAGKIRAQLCVTLTALGIRVLHMFLWWNLIAKKRPSEWAPGNSRLIFKVRCLDKDDLLLHRWCWRVQDAHCDGTRASAGRVIKAWLLPRIQSQMKKVHGLHRAGFWVLLDSEVKTCSFNGVWCKYEPVPVWCQAKKALMRWVEMKCKCEVWTVGCEEFNVKCEESVCVAPINELTNPLTNWRTHWRIDEPIDELTNPLTNWRTHWRIDEPIDELTNPLTKWRTHWRIDEPTDELTNPLTNWRTHWRIDEPIDELTNPLTNWRTHWRIDEPIDELTNPLTNWRTHWRIDEPTNALTNPLTNWRTHWRIDEPIDELTNPLTNCDELTNPARNWRTHWRIDEPIDELTNSLTIWDQTYILSTPSEQASKKVVYLSKTVYTSIQGPAGQPASRQMKSSEEQSKRVVFNSADGRRLWKNEKPWKTWFVKTRRNWPQILEGQRVPKSWFVTGFAPWIGSPTTHGRGMGIFEWDFLAVHRKD